jgi:hypothetical protein
VITVYLDGFLGRMTHVVLKMIEHISERIKREWLFRSWHHLQRWVGRQ